MSHRSQVIIIALLFFHIFGIQQIFATPYGGGTYGDQTYDETISAPGPSSTGVPDAGCAAIRPGSAPWLYAVRSESATTILLYFTDAADPVSSYALEYGIEPGNFRYSATNIGGKGMRMYRVQSLMPATKYEFRMLGSNGCATGPWSNVQSGQTLAVGEPIIPPDDADRIPPPTPTPPAQAVSTSPQDTRASTTLQEQTDGKKTPEEQRQQLGIPYIVGCLVALGVLIISGVILWSKRS